MRTRISMQRPPSGLMFISLFCCLVLSCGAEKEVRLLPEDYSRWDTTHPGFLEYPIAGHTAPVRRIFVNQTGAAFRDTPPTDGRYPDGTIFIKENYTALHQAETQPDSITAMVKDRENPDAVGGWVWLAVDGATRNETVVTGRFCVSCHRAANDAHAYGDKNPDREFRDFIFLPPFAKLQDQ